MSRRLSLWIVLGLLNGSVASAETPPPPADPAARLEAAPAQAAGAGDAQLSAAGSAPEPAKYASGQPGPLAGFRLLATLGYGNRTAPIYDVKLEPYGATFGLESSYTFTRGFRLGVYLDYGLGRTIRQTYEPRFIDEFEYSAAATSLHTGLTLGHDLPLHFLILRYSLNVGVTWLSWDLTDVRSPSLLGFAASSGSTWGFHLAPGLAVLWPLIDRFECGVGFDYFVQVEDVIPSGFLAKLLLGVRL